MAERKPLHYYWTPRYWLSWFGLGVLRLICLLPHGAALAVGRAIGRFAHRIGILRRILRAGNR